MAFALGGGRLHFPGMSKPEAVDLPVTSVGGIGSIGPYHADINGRTATGGIRGPFDKQAIQQGAVPTYPILWEHEAERERTIAFEAEAECIPRVGRDDDEQRLIDRIIEALWRTASHCHFNRDFRFNSRSPADFRLADVHGYRSNCQTLAARRHLCSGAIAHLVF